MCWTEWTVPVLVAILCTSGTATGGPVCYQCQDIGVPEKCNVSETCPDNHQCYVEETVSEDTFSVRFNLGCETYETCQAFLHIPDPVGKRWVSERTAQYRRDTRTTCLKCCNKDFCNLSNCAGLCQSNPCLNDGTCTSHRTNNFTCQCTPGHHGTLCEIATEQLVCQQCQGVKDPATCNHAVRCRKGEKCYTEAIQSEDGISYTLGCAAKQTCDFYDQLLVRDLVGRQAADVVRCHTCCDGPHCNKQTCLYAEKSCDDYYKTGHRVSGIYNIDLRDGQLPFNVYCDMGTAGAGWVVFQRRIDGSVDFYQNWTYYQKGFGDISSSFWIGNDKLHRMTTAKLTHLRVDLGDWENRKVYAEYSSFTVGDEASKYVLHVSGYSGTANDSLLNHSGQEFSTFDADNDSSDNNNCAQSWHGAWWYNDCYYSNLNGIYGRGLDSRYVVWRGWQEKSGLKFTEMKVR